MSVAITDIAEISNLKRNRDQLTSRIDRIRFVTNLAGMAELVSGLGIDEEIVAIARKQVAQYLATKKSDLDAQLVALGVDLGA